MGAFLHIADISNSMKPFKICKVWAWKVLDEFFRQGDEEKKLGIPVQALNDREKVNRPFSQIGFIEFLVSPLVHIFIRVFPPTGSYAMAAADNIQTWLTIWSEEVRPGRGEEEAVIERVKKLRTKLKDTMANMYN